MSTKVDATPCDWWGPTFIIVSATWTTNVSPMLAQWFVDVLVACFALTFGKGALFILLSSCVALNTVRWLEPVQRMCHCWVCVTSFLIAKTTLTLSFLLSFYLSTCTSWQMKWMLVRILLFWKDMSSSFLTCVFTFVQSSGGKKWFCC